MSYSGPFPFPVVSGGTGQTKSVAFSSYLNTGLSNATGDGTNVALIFDTTIVNVNSGYSVSTGIFTAPVAGNYFFSVQIEFNNLGAGHTGDIIAFTGSLSSTAYQWNSRNNPKAAASGNNGGYQTAGIIVPMAINDTIRVNCSVSGSTKTVGITGATGTLTNIFTYFSGYLLH